MEGRSRSGAVAGVGLEWNLGHAKSEAGDAAPARRTGSPARTSVKVTQPRVGPSLAVRCHFGPQKSGLEWSGVRGALKRREAVGVADGRPAEVLDNDKSPRHCSALFPSGGRARDGRDANKNAA